MTLNANWVAQVLRDRGARPPPAAKIESYLALLDPAGLATATDLVQSILRGTESVSDLDAFLSNLHGHRLPSNPSTSQPPAEKVIPITSKRASGCDGDSLDAQDLALLREQGFHVYSTKTAMKVELSLAQRARAGKRYTISLDIAAALSRQNFDWEHKLTFQFMLSELPRLGAFLMGYAPGPLVLKNHGTTADKFLELADQGGKLYVKLRQGTSARALPVEPADVHAWASICLTALRLNTPALDGAVHLEMLKRVGTMGTAQ